MGGVLFCASSDERRYGKFTVVLAQTVNFIQILEERRDNARTQFWHMAARAKYSSDERRYGKFTVVLAQTVNFIQLLEERRDNAGTQFWHMAARAKQVTMTTPQKDVIITQLLNGGTYDLQ